MTPALLNEVQFTVEFWEIQGLEPTHFGISLKNQVNIDKIQLVVHHAVAAAGGRPFRTVCEFLSTLYLLVLNTMIPAFLQDTCHLFEVTSAFMTIRIIKLLFGAILEFPI